MTQPKGWHSRGYLPHFDSPQTVQFVTFRLADSLPEAVASSIRHRGDDDRICGTESSQGRADRRCNPLDREFGSTSKRFMSGPEARAPARLPDVELAPHGDVVARLGEAALALVDADGGEAVGGLGRE